MSNEPKRHHYIPQFFSKAWEDDHNVLHMVDKSNKEKIIKVTTKNFGLEQNLYKLNSQIESLFITPFIDNLHNSISLGRENSWDNLSQSIKNDIYKFIILLDARNPKSINDINLSILSCKSKFLNLLKSTHNLENKILKEIECGLDNGVLIFLMIAMQEIGITADDLETNIQDGIIKDTIKLCLELLSLKSNLIYPFCINGFDKNIFVDEVICKENNLITSDRAISKRGIYSKKFTLVFNISPQKGYFISNEPNIICLYKKMNNFERINYFNQAIEKFATRFIIYPKKI